LASTGLTGARACWWEINPNFSQKVAALPRKDTF
jgi:hypothetical protein